MAMKLSTTNFSLFLLLLLSLLILPSHCYTQREHENKESSPEKYFSKCLAKCDERRHSSSEQRSQCHQQCMQRYEQRKEEHAEPRGGGGGGEHEQNGDRHRPEEKQGSENPYYFESRRFDSLHRSEEGHIRVLERFSERSDVLGGVADYRIASLEINPHTIVLPHHVDAELVLVVVRGKGMVNYVWQKQRRSYNLKRGDVLRVPAASILYLINHDNEEKFYAVKLLRPVNAPGRFEPFYGIGGENLESFLKIFSNEILEPSFNSPREELDSLFEPENEGAIIKASEEQIRSLSQGSESESSRGRRGEKYWEPINLFEQPPLFQNEFGQHLEVSPDNHEQLRDLDVSVGFMNIKKGAMTPPYFNSWSEKMVFVEEGKGNYEMACPHLSSKGGQEKQGNVHYMRVSANLSAGDVFVFPAGHPIAIVASEDSDLKLVSFGIKGSFNQKYFLAGEGNVWDLFPPEIKELVFKKPAIKVEEIVRKQNKSQFVPASSGQQQREEGRGRFVASILDFAGF